jgi:hypothetical protein
MMLTVFLLQNMTRRKNKSKRRIFTTVRENRIAKLLSKGWIKDSDEIPKDAIPVDPDLINRGGSWDYPTCFRDQPFVCIDCGCERIWKATDQKWYFEVLHHAFYKTAKRCTACRAIERERKKQARISAGHGSLNETSK